MRGIPTGILAIIALLAPLQSRANECWAISNIKGYSAFADEGYKFSQDGMKSPLLVCFTSNGGTVTGTDVRFVKFGESTLAGYGGNDQGNELFEIYQIDRAKKKLLYAKSRIGTKTVVPVLSDVVSAFVGDAAMVSK
jgi:hypothetical protein